MEPSTTGGRTVTVDVLAVVGLAITGGSLAMAAIFAAIWRVRTGMTRGWTTTTGVVVTRRSGRTEGAMPALYPTFRWTDQHGHTHQRTSSVRQSFGPAPGRHMPVRYDPDSPDRAVIDTFAQSGRVFGLVAVIIAAMGLSTGLPLLALGLSL